MSKTIKISEEEYTLICMGLREVAAQEGAAEEAAQQCLNRLVSVEPDHSKLAVLCTVRFNVEGPVEPRELEAHVAKKIELAVYASEENGDLLEEWGPDEVTFDDLVVAASVEEVK